MDKPRIAVDCMGGDYAPVVGMSEPPSNVLKKKSSSLYIAGLLLRENMADGLVSAGNTGAVLTVGKFLVGALEGIERPSICFGLNFRYVL
jgi:fatty acid/phospholipid biosynthesis enzyme